MNVNFRLFASRCLGNVLVPFAVLCLAMSGVRIGGEEGSSNTKSAGVASVKKYSETACISSDNRAEGPTPTPGCVDAWTSTSDTNAPVGRYYHSAAWTGSEMIVWGGTFGAGHLNTGGRYDRATDSWLATSMTNAPTAREGHTAVWTGIEMIVWGGTSVEPQTGGRYNPKTDSWVPTSVSNAPRLRIDHTAVWTGSEMIVWGGWDGFNALDSGGRYNPSTDTWVATSTINAPTKRFRHTAVWTGTEMIVWGGYDGTSGSGTGSRYNPSADTWVAVGNSGAPSARGTHTAVWTGTEMIVWGGYDGTSGLGTGSRYNPSTDTWVAVGNSGAPSARRTHTAVWTGTEMIVWGGYDGTSVLGTGSRYNPSTDTWVAVSNSGAPEARSTHTAVWTGNEMIVWGGFPGTGALNTGARYCAKPPPTPTPCPMCTPTPTVSPSTILGNISTRLGVETGNNVLIGGFIVTGTQPKKVIVRAIGPSLPVSEALADPILELRNSVGQLIWSNDDWRSDQLQQISDTGIPPGNASESAIVVTLPANNSAYTAIVRGADNGTGVGLVEVYDLDQTVDSKLANISTRGLVQTGNDVMIAGTIVLGQTEQRVLVRAIGPSLTLQGKLADPTLELRDGSGTLIRANDNWRSDQEQEIIATGIPPSNDLESAVVAILPANGAAYTAIVRGVNDATGVALTEIYGLTN